LLERHLSPNKAFYAIRVPEWVYAEYQNGDKELYDMVADPYQLQNVANQAPYQARQAELAQRLRVLRES
jgi:hypothetical protein